MILKTSNVIGNQRDLEKLSMSDDVFWRLSPKKESTEVGELWNEILNTSRQHLGAVLEAYGTPALTSVFVNGVKAEIGD